MAKFIVEMRLTEIHEYTIEAANIEEAIEKIYEEDPKPDFITPESWEVEHWDEKMSDKDYYDARGRNKDFLEGNEKIVLDEMVEC